MTVAMVPPEANYDEALVGDYVLPPLLVEGSDADASTVATARAHWRDVFARGLFGELPAAPDRLEWTRRSIDGGDCEHIRIELGIGGRTFAVDAALWLPTSTQVPVPIVVGLDFLGPFGALASDDYPLDAAAIVALPPWFGGGQGPLHEVLRGTAAHRFPVKQLRDAGYGVLTSCYGSWVPDDPQASRAHGLWPLLGLDRADDPPGAVCLWSWAIGRLIDIAVALPEIDAGRVVVAGHSRLGKAALWASVNDARVSALFLNESGCGGAALSRRNFGETFAHNRHKFPHWLLSHTRAAAAGLDEVDQHQLLALMAPRRLYVASAVGDLWCDPRGEYLGLKAAAPMWPGVAFPEAGEAFFTGNGLNRGALGWHLRAGGHELTPCDWARFLRFMAG